MTARSTSALGAAALILATLFSSAAHAQSAEILIEQGLELRRQQRDAEALQRFQDAYQLSHSAQALAQIALAEQALGSYVEAEAHLQQALAVQDMWVNSRRPQLQQALAQISAQLGTVEITGGVAGAEVYVNGTLRATFPQAARIRARAGSAVIEIRAQGYVPVQRTVMVTAGGTARETIQLIAAGGGGAVVQPGGGGGGAVVVQGQGQPTYGAYQPQQVRYETRPRIGLFIAGIPIFLVPYLLTGSITYAINPEYAEEAYFGFIPFAGPFLLIDYLEYDDTGLGITFLILSGVAQLAGVTMMVLGLVLQSEVAVRAQLGNEPDAPTLTFEPLVGRDFAGAGLTLTHF